VRISLSARAVRVRERLEVQAVEELLVHPAFSSVAGAAAGDESWATATARAVTVRWLQTEAM
jgi:hypothetical protein